MKTTSQSGQSERSLKESHIPLTADLTISLGLRGCGEDWLRLSKRAKQFLLKLFKTLLDNEGDLLLGGYYSVGRYRLSQDESVAMLDIPRQGILPSRD